MKNNIIAFTDGSSLGNPGLGGWGAVVVFGSDKVLEIGGREQKTTNNRMELTAAIEALRAMDDTRVDIEILTDSQYVKNGITKWVYGWQQKDWKTATKESVWNRDLWEILVEEEKNRKRFGDVLWQYVAGHIGHAGNERADVIAVAFAKKGSETLFNGAVSDYKIDLSKKVNTKISAELLEKKARAKQKAYSYLSLVDGILKRHTVWAECEARVKNKKAKFRKTISMKDEKNILDEWGVSFEDQ
ncbi:ribonuclease HI [Patescibacteria group bacterium]|nr:ribonuclease HI [Patescibacteria group bacterium]